MNQDTLWGEYSTLPPQAQKLVVDFLALMKKSYNQMPLAASKSVETRSILDEPFIGMWQDRDEMADSSTWVREARKREWG